MGEAEALYVHDLDRLVRTAQQLEALKQFAEMNRLVLDILEDFAEGCQEQGP